MEIPVFITAAAMLLSKFLDCLSTLLSLGDLQDEKNKFAKAIMKAIGINTGIWMNFLLAGFIIGLATWYIFAFSPTLLAKSLYVGIGIVITAIQLAVAHHNFTGKENFITKGIRKIKLYR